MRTIIDKILGFFRYLLGKRSELRDLDFKDVLLAKVILDIHRKRTGTRFIEAPLYALKPVHPIDRESSLAAAGERAAELREHRDRILAGGVASREVLAKHIPSVSWIKVVRVDDDEFIAYEGNGRIAAMQRVFEPGDGLLVEVEEYVFRNPKKIIRRLDRVRRLNGLIP
jgi:hypothetical protein